MEIGMESLFLGKHWWAVNELPLILTFNDLLKELACTFDVL